MGPVLQNEQNIVRDFNNDGAGRARTILRRIGDRIH